MKLRLWFRDGWFLFSAFISVVILVFLAVPSFFGLQNFVQWGAMYDDRWCTVALYENNPHNASVLPRVETLVPGSDVRRVYSGPTHNEKTCIALAYSRCGTQSRDGWTATWVEPEFKGVRFLGQANVCAFDLSALRSWFSYADK